jgi:hypothetical protein
MRRLLPLFDPLFRGAALVVEPHDGAIGEREIRHDEADAAGTARRRGVRLSPRPVWAWSSSPPDTEAFVPNERLEAGPSRWLKQDVLDRQLEVVVGRDADRVLDAACLQRLVDRRPREGRVGAERDPLVLGLLAVDLGHEQCLPIVRAGDVPRYHVLAAGQEYRNLGPDYYEHRDVDRARARAVHALERLGVKVTVEAVA